MFILHTGFLTVLPSKCFWASFVSVGVSEALFLCYIAKSFLEYEQIITIISIAHTWI